MRIRVGPEVCKHFGFFYPPPLLSAFSPNLPYNASFAPCAFGMPPRTCPLSYTSHVLPGCLWHFRGALGRLVNFGRARFVGRTLPVPSGHLLWKEGEKTLARLEVQPFQPTFTCSVAAAEGDKEGGSMAGSRPAAASRHLLHVIHRLWHSVERFEVVKLLKTCIGLF